MTKKDHYTYEQNDTCFGAKRGVALLISIMIVGILSIISVYIVAVNLSQVRSSSMEEITMRSYYAAESGLECVAFYDIIRRGTEGAGRPKDMYCEGNNPTRVNRRGGRSFEANIEFSNNTCASVYITKANNGDTEFMVKGRNSPDCTASGGPRVAERVLYAAYDVD